MRYLILILILLICSLSDLKKRKVKDRYIWMGVIINPAVFYFLDNDLWGLLYNFIGAIIVTIFLMFVVLACEKIFNKQVMGGADIKLIFMCGLYISWDKLLWVLFIALIGVMLTDIILKIKKRANVRFPFVPFLFCSVIIVLLPTAIKCNYLTSQVAGGF